MSILILSCLIYLTSVLAFPIEEFNPQLDIQRRRVSSNNNNIHNDKKLRLFGSDLSSSNINKHSYTASLYGFKDHLSPYNSWVGGNVGYKHTPTGSQVSVNGNRTSTTTDLEANGNINFNADHSLFGSLNSQKNRSTVGKIGYSHKPTDTEISLHTFNNPTGTEFSLNGKTDLYQNNGHHFKGLFTAKQGVGENPFSLNTMMNYNHAATGSGLTLGTDVSNNNLSLYGTGRLNLNNRHTLTSSLKIDKDRSSNQGELKYIHKPSSSELTFGFKNEPTKTDLSLKGQTQLSNHRLSGSTLFSNNNNRDATSINTSLEYNHKPSNSDLTFGFENKKTGTDLTLKGKTQFSNDHHLGGSAFLNQKFGQLSSMGASLDYNHKPSNSSLNFGYQTRKSGTDLFLTGQTQNDKHSLSSGFFKNTAGGLSTSLDYMHKPSNSKIGLVFENNMHGQQVNLNGDFNLNNKARLGLGGHFANGPNSSSAGFQIAGAF